MKIPLKNLDFSFRRHQKRAPSPFSVKGTCFPTYWGPLYRLDSMAPSGNLGINTSPDGPQGSIFGGGPQDGFSLITFVPFDVMS